jgi:hypothetical protein
VESVCDGGEMAVIAWERHIPGRIINDGLGWGMSDPDEKYADIRERRRRVARVRSDLLKYVNVLDKYKGYYAENARASEDERVRADTRRTYYRLINTCLQWLSVPVGLLEAERRIKEVVMPNLREARRLGVDRVWFLYGETVKKIDDFVQRWFGEQAADQELRGLVSFELYQLCEYRHRDAWALPGLQALKDACWGAYVSLWMVSSSDAQYQQTVISSRMWKLQAAREAFAAAVAGAAATAREGTRAAAAEVEGLLDAVMADVDRLVTVLAKKDAQAPTAPKTEAVAGVDVAAPEEGEEFEVLKTETGVGKFGDTNVFEIKKDRRTGEV